MVWEIGRRPIGERIGDSASRNMPSSFKPGSFDTFDASEFTSNLIFFKARRDEKIYELATHDTLVEKTDMKGAIMRTSSLVVSANLWILVAVSLSLVVLLLLADETESVLSNSAVTFLFATAVDFDNGEFALYVLRAEGDL